MTTAANAINEATTGICGFTGTAFTGSAVTQHCVLIGASTSSTINSVTNGTTGQVLLANTSADPSWGSVPTPKPGTNVSLVDDFIGAGSPGATSFGSGVVISSNYIWSCGGGLVFPPTNATNKATPGILSSSLLSITLNNNIFLAGTSAAAYLPFIFGGGVITLNFYVNIGTLSTVTNRYVFRVGFGDSAAGTTSDNTVNQANGAYFEYSDNLNSGNWILKTANASTRTSNNTGTAVATGWHNFQVTVNVAASSINFTLDGVSLGDNVANIPTTNPVTPFVQVLQTAGTSTAGTFLIDLFQLTQTLTTPR